MSTHPMTFDVYGGDDGQLLGSTSATSHLQAFRAIIGKGRFRSTGRFPSLQLFGYGALRYYVVRRAGEYAATDYTAAVRAAEATKWP